ncbi:AtpZ/AtpI family protein [Actinomycetota bacterium]
MSEPSQRPDPYGPSEGPSPTARADALGATVLAYLITGPALFGGVGYGLDRLLDTSFVTPIGVVAGMVLSMYVIWLRYGSP